MTSLTEREFHYKEILTDIEDKVYHAVEDAEIELLKKNIDSCILEFPNWYFGYFCDAQYVLAKSYIENMFLLVKDYDAALILYAKAIELDPQNIELYLSRAYLNSCEGTYDKVILDYKKVIELNPNIQEAYAALAFAAHWETQDYETAIKMYSKVIELENNNASTFFARGNVKIEIKDYSGAIADFNKAIEIEPEFWRYYIKRGVAKKEINDFAGALSDFNIAINLNSGISEAYEERGKLKELLNDFNGAKEDFEKANEHDSSFF